MSDENEKKDENPEKPEETAAPESTTRPEDIDRRLAKLAGKEDELDRVARLEEEKLAARRKAQRKGTKKTGLESAASKKLAKIGTRAEPRRSVAVAADADPLIEKTVKLSEWAKKNQTAVMVAGGLLVVGLLGAAGYMYHAHNQELEASVMLAKAVSDERARIGEPPKDDEEGDGQPVFKSFEDRREAALKEYKQIESQFPKSGAAILARLAEGSLLLDKRDADGAAAAFNDVKGSALAAADQEVRGRALEGLGFAYELKAEKDPPNAAKNRDEALKTFKEMESSVEVRGFKEMAMYHQGRVLMEQGEKDKAKELLKSLRERISKPEDNSVVFKNMNIPAGPAYPYLSQVVQDRLHQLDPNEAAPGGAAGGGAAGAGGAGMPKNISPAQLKQLEEQMKKMQQKQQQGGAGGGGKGGH